MEARVFPRRRCGERSVRRSGAWVAATKGKRKPFRRTRKRGAGVTEKIHPLSSEQFKALLDAANGDRLQILYVLAVHTGLRQGELLGLKRDDIYLEEGALQVRRA